MASLARGVYPQPCDIVALLASPPNFGRLKGYHPMAIYPGRWNQVLFAIMLHCVSYRYRYYPAKFIYRNLPFYHGAYLHGSVIRKLQCYHFLPSEFCTMAALVTTYQTVLEPKSPSLRKLALSLSDSGERPSEARVAYRDRGLFV